MAVMKPFKTTLDQEPPAPRPRPAKKQRARRPAVTPPTTQQPEEAWSTTASAGIRTWRSPPPSHLPKKFIKFWLRMNGERVGNTNVSGTIMPRTVLKAAVDPVMDTPIAEEDVLAGVPVLGLPRGITHTQL